MDSKITYDDKTIAHNIVDNHDICIHDKSKATGLEKPSHVSHTACVGWLLLVYRFNAVNKICTVELWVGLFMRCA
jgi:hypothetical protein